MFAQRFDPNNIISVQENDTAASKKLSIIKPKSILPLKRTVNDRVSSNGHTYKEKSDDEEEEEDEDEEEQDSDVHVQMNNSDKDEELENKEDLDQEIEIDVNSNTTINNPKKFDSVFNRFQQTISLQDRLISQQQNMENDNVLSVNNDQETVHDLTQIPQPERIHPTSLKDKDKNSTENLTINAINTAFMSTKRIFYDKEMSKPFDDFKSDLDPRLLNNIVKNFSSTAFPIQTSLWSNILPRINSLLKVSKKNFTRRIGDQLINASTGSGKTLAYSVPLIQSLINRKCNKLRAIILVPTRLLINQVCDTLLKLSNRTNLVIMMTNLDKSLREEHERLLNIEPDILIVTPGRLVDHLNLKSINLSNLKFLILDEADRLLNQSFQNWCSELLNHLSVDKAKVDPLPGNVIKMIFSATLTTNTEKLHDLNLYNPKLYMMDSVKLYNLPTNLKEYNIKIGTAKSIYKPLLLLKLINSSIVKNNTDEPFSPSKKILIFIKSNEAAIRLKSLLSIIIEFFPNNEMKFSIDSINSNNTKLVNKKILQKFAGFDKSNNTDTQNNVAQILITTDLMSRGIDINHITDVINYDLPISSQQYVHRCGRTARANNMGKVYNILVGKGEQNFWYNNIDIDISRTVGNEVDDSKFVEILKEINSEDESKYMECLNIFKQQQQFQHSSS